MLAPSPGSLRETTNVLILPPSLALVVGACPKARGRTALPSKELGTLVVNMAHALFTPALEDLSSAQIRSPVAISNSQRHHRDFSSLKSEWLTLSTFDPLFFHRTLWFEIARDLLARV